MRNLRRLAATLLALLVVAGCTGDLGTPTERVNATTEQVGASEVSRVDVDATTVWLQFLEGDQYMGATKFKDKDASTQVGNPSEGYIPQRPVDELGLDAFSERLAAVADTCNKGNYGGRIFPTVGGAVLQQIGCADWTFSAVYLDDQELQPITAWDEATLDRILAEVKAVHGATSRDLVFQTPKGSSFDSSYSLAFTSGEQTSWDGQPCRISSWRSGEHVQDRPMLSYAPCTPGPDQESLSDADFEIDRLSGAKIVTALQTGAELMGIAASDIGDFTVVFSRGELKLQLRAGAGVPAKQPTVAVTL